MRKGRHPIRKAQNCLSTALILLVVSVLSVHATSFYVSQAGNDKAAGTKAKPFKTLRAAQEAVREQNIEGLSEDITVYLRKGIHHQAEPLVFGPNDGGTSAHRVTYTSYGGGTARISGGMILEGTWKKGKGSIWKITIPAVRDDSLWFRQLFVDGRRAVRARYPDNDSILKIWDRSNISEYQNELTFSFSLDHIDFSTADAEMVAFHIWASGRSYLDRWEGNTAYLRGPIGEIDARGPSTKPQSRFYVEHAREFVTQSGEWHCERSTGVLRYYAPSGEDPNDSEFIIPVVESLIVIDGTPEKPVRNLHFENLAIEHCEWFFPDVGYQGGQAGHYKPVKALPSHMIPLAIQIEYAENCGFTECLIAHVAQTAIGFGRACRNNSIIGCEITDVGGTGIMVGWRENMHPDGIGNSEDWPEESMVPKGNVVRNNYVHHCGRIYYGAIGIFAGFVKNTTISRNHVAHLPYTGISVGFCWGSRRTSMETCFTDSNHIHDVMQYLCDGGGIYAIGYQPGTTMLGNLIHDVWRRPEAHGNTNNGFSLDESVRGYHVGYNTVYNISGNLLQFYRSSDTDNVVDTNYLFKRRDEVPDSLLEHARSIAGLEPDFEYLNEPDHWGLGYPAPVRHPRQKAPSRVHFSQAAKPDARVLLFNAAGRRINVPVFHAGRSRTFHPAAGVYILVGNRQSTTGKRTIHVPAR